jgi:L-seryl-tRNA(Ser) seleniumtransferase
VIGGGAAPGSTLPTALLAITPDGVSADELATHLRHHEPPTVVRVENNQILVDLRTVFPHQDSLVASALADASHPNPR